MRYVRIFLLHVQDVLQNRGRSFVWFLVVVINPAIYLLFWKGAIQKDPAAGWNFSSIATYYFLIVIASSLLVVHIEEDIAYRDIKEGGLVKYLLQPFSYFLRKFIEEIPWRVIQGSFGVIVLFFVMFFYRGLLNFPLTPALLFLSVIIIALGYLMSFIFKMIVGISALWVTEYRGLANLVEFIVLVFSGMILPLELYPQPIKLAAQLLPFSYMVYYPVVSIQGKLAIPALFEIIGKQVIWIIALYGIYRWLWRKGVYKFTGIGQ